MPPGRTARSCGSKCGGCEQLQLWGPGPMPAGDAHLGEQAQAESPAQRRVLSRQHMVPTVCPGCQPCAVPHPCHAPMLRCPRTLLDNLEWATGYTMKFGLYAWEPDGSVDRVLKVGAMRGRGEGGPGKGRDAVGVRTAEPQRHACRRPGGPNTSRQQALEEPLLNRWHDRSRPFP